MDLPLPQAADSSVTLRADSRALTHHRGELPAWLSILVLVAATLGMLLPFLDKPFHIDDPLFVWGAQHLRGSLKNETSLQSFFPGGEGWRKLFDCYGFDMLWNVHIEPMHQVTQNPPLAI